jgi:hypothetical protein
MKKNKILFGAIGLGVLFLGYKAFKKRQESNLVSKTDNLNIPKKSNFDREKASKELATIYFPIIIENKNVKKPEMQLFVTDVKTGLQMALASSPTKNTKVTELSLYNKILEGLNGISDDSDAEFIVNVFKKYFQSGGDNEFKSDLDTQIRIDKIQKKYPDALKQLDLSQ